MATKFNNTAMTSDQTLVPGFRIVSNMIDFVSPALSVFKKSRCFTDSIRLSRDVAKEVSDLKSTANQASKRARSDAKAVDMFVTGLGVCGVRPARVVTPARSIGYAYKTATALLVLLGSSSVSHALEGTKVGERDTAFPVAIAQPGTVPLKKVAPLESSLAALQYAAEGGHPVAQWKLGRMYADGNGVSQDNLRAFDYFSRIANAHAEDSPTAPQAAIVANAFVELGRYFLEGIPNSRVKPDAGKAREMLSYAASYFGNADAQYDLARLYLQGVGTPRDLRYGVRWLGLAAQKGQHHAQAMLGQMLFNGDQLPKQSARGLMWLTLARDSASTEEAWIQESYNKAITKASEDDRAMALKMLEDWVQGRR